MSLRQVCMVRRVDYNLSIPKPPLGHSVPFSLILRLLRQLGHTLAFSGNLANPSAGFIAPSLRMSGN
jgi:hypothetical protein